MLIKSIRCQVEKQKKGLFSKGQTQWEPVSHVKGFLGQLGGWCEQDPNQAWIIAFWENPSTYQHFMKEVHDRIFLSSGQGKTYSAIYVDFFEMDHQPQQMASFVENCDVLNVEVLESTLRISGGKSNEETTFTANASDLNGHLLSILSDNIQVEEAWRVVPIKSPLFPGEK